MNKILSLSTALLVSMMLVISPVVSAKESRSSNQEASANVESPAPSSQHDHDDHDDDDDNKENKDDNKDDDNKDDENDNEDSTEKAIDASKEVIKEDFKNKDEAVNQSYEQQMSALEGLKNTLSKEEYEAQKQQLEGQYEDSKEWLDTLKDQIKEERKAILEQYKDKKDELKAIADELKKKIEDSEENEEEELYESLAEFYNEAGALTEAIAAQKEAVKLDLMNLERYKSFSKLLEKEGYTGIKAFVNGDMPRFEISPMIKEGITLIPFRAVSEALKAEVKWNAEDNSVTVMRDGTEIKLIIGQAIAYVNGKEVILEVPAQIEQGNTIVPVRFISESLGANVQWEADTQSVVIVDTQTVTTPQAPAVPSTTTEPNPTSQITTP
jgi:tetratricopeptide (TPR) repeat protein